MYISVIIIINCKPGRNRGEKNYHKERLGNHPPINMKAGIRTIDTDALSKYEKIQTGSIIGDDYDVESLVGTNHIRMVVDVSIECGTAYPQ